jgi:hypothetical protein
MQAVNSRAASNSESDVQKNEMGSGERDYENVVPLGERLGAGQGSAINKLLGAPNARRADGREPLLFSEADQ